MFHRLPWVVLGSVWSLILGVQIHSLLRYQGTPGPSQVVQDQWPVGSAIVRANGYQLLMFVHPQCPCSRASLRSLRPLLEQHSSVSVTIVCVLPRGVDASWESAPIWSEARAIPGAQVIADRDGREAVRFGAWTSGQIIVHDESGRRLFDGGVTPARGHNGPCRGLLRLHALFQFREAPAPGTPVFGCPLLDEFPA